MKFLVAPRPRCLVGLCLAGLSAVLLTGAYPERTSITGNEWRKLEAGAPVHSTLLYSCVAEHVLGLPRSF
jgi:hypothetical protein